MSAPSKTALDAAQALDALGAVGITAQPEWTPAESGEPPAPTSTPAPTPAPESIEGRDVGAAAADASESTATSPPTLDALIASVKADPLGHLDPDVIAGALTLSPRDLETLTAILKTNNRSLRPFNAALAQARKAARDAKKAAASSPRAPSDAPQILIHNKELQVADQAIAALAADTTIYQRARMLVRVAVDGNRDLPPAIEPLPEHTLRERLSECVNWVREVVDDEGGKKLLAEHPPSWAVKAILSRGEWKGLRNLTAVTVCPLMRLDGTVINATGYDSATGYLFIPTHGVMYPPVPDAPTHEEVQAALDLLLEPIADFEFDTLGPFNADNCPAMVPDPCAPACPDGSPAPLTKGPTPEEQNQRMNIGCALAMILTLLARPAIKGPVPLGAFNACTPGTGKTLLCRVVVYIGTGLEMVTSNCTEDPDEDRKAALGHLMAGEKCVVFDNVAGVLGNGVIDALVTAWPTYAGRELGKNNSPKVPALTFWLATGNNLRIHDDTVRRTLRSSLRSTYDDPSDRDPETFRHGNLMEWVEANRPRLVCAALTILRGWVCAGRPREKLRPWPSFEAWAAIVPQVLAWLGFPDIGRSQVDLQKANEATSALAKLIRGWERACALECSSAVTGSLDTLDPPPGPDREAKTAMQVVNLLRKPEHTEALSELREAIEELANGKSPEKIGHLGLGRLLGRFKGRACEGRALFPSRSNANNAWEVRRVRGAQGTPESVPASAGTPADRIEGGE